MIRSKATWYTQTAAFTMVMVLFLMLFSFPVNAAQSQHKKTATTISVSLLKGAAGAIQSETHTETTLKSSQVIFDFASVEALVTSTSTSDLLFLSVNPSVHNPFYTVPTVHAP
jgi:hypothetical protein